MDEKAMSFNEGQLKRTGFAEAFTPELKAQMEQGVAVIQHNFKKEYDGDKVDATLHLKKSATSDYYFLNKFDLGSANSEPGRGCKTNLLFNKKGESQVKRALMPKHKTGQQVHAKRRLQFISRTTSITKIL